MTNSLTFIYLLFCPANVRLNKCLINYGERERGREDGRIDLHFKIEVSGKQDVYTTL